MTSAVGFYSVKIFAIVFTTILYVLAGIVISLGVEEMITDEKVESLSTLRLIAELLGMFCLIAVLYYAVRIQIKHTPSFLDGLFGFNHLRLREATGDITIAYILYAYQHKLEARLKEVKRRVDRWLAR